MALVPVFVVPAVVVLAGVAPLADAGLMVSFPAVDAAGATVAGAFCLAMYQIAASAAIPIPAGTA